jgi:hypothetical protein
MDEALLHYVKNSFVFQTVQQNIFSLFLVVALLL